MASFRTHLSFGVVLGAAVAISAAVFALVAWDAKYFGLLSLVAIVGALMPDMDSDSSVPFHVTFGLLSLVAGGLSLLYVLGSSPVDYAKLVGYPLAAIFIVWVVIGSIFKKFTCHRGMAHSIPSALLAGLAVFSLTVLVGQDEWRSFLIGLSLTLGYLLHLLLDEAYAAVNFRGQLFVPNKAFGSALKLFSHRRVINVVVYGAVIFLMAVNYQAVSGLTLKLLSVLKA